MLTQQLVHTQLSFLVFPMLFPVFLMFPVSPVFLMFLFSVFPVFLMFLMFPVFLVFPMFPVFLASIQSATNLNCFGSSYCFSILTHMSRMNSSSKKLFYGRNQLYQIQTATIKMSYEDFCLCFTMIAVRFGKHFVKIGYTKPVF